MKRLAVLALPLFLAVSLNAAGKPAVKAAPKKAAAPAAAEPAWKSKPGTYAVFTTGKGRIVAKLFEDLAPKTVANFTGLAEGTKEYTDPRDNQKKTGRFYDGLKFPRVVRGFMIQGGDPLNNTMGGPGYEFADEPTPTLHFDKPGVLAMANSGPNTNGSQFFITDVPGGSYNRLPTHLDGHYNVFGQVIEGMPVVTAIASVPVNGDMAVDPVVCEKVEIVRVAASAKPAASAKAPAKAAPAKKAAPKPAKKKGK